MIDFSRNHFELFGLPPAFRFDAAVLDRAYRQCNPKCIPTALPAPATPRSALALQSSARVNEAYRALKDPVQRAQYLLRLHGVDAVSETDTALPLEFLERQLERREQAADAQAAGDVAHAAALLADARAESARARGACWRRSSTASAPMRRRARRCANSRSWPSWPRTSTRCWPRSKPDGAVPDLRARRVARAAPAQARGRHRPRHHQFAGRHGAQRTRRGAARRAKAARWCRRSFAMASRASRPAMPRWRTRPTTRRTRSSPSSA